MTLLAMTCASCGDVFSFTDTSAMMAFKSAHEKACRGPQPGDERGDAERLADSLNLFLKDLPENSVGESITVKKDK